MSKSALMCPSTYTTMTGYNRPLLDIELNFDLCRTYTWERANWTLCFYFIAAYLLVIFVGRMYMKSRPPFQLRLPLVFWNVALATFSIVSTWRTSTALIYAMQNNGFKESVCSMESLGQRQSIGLWMFLFQLSKIVELGDTAFIVLKKSPLSFLHWYHHATVTFFVWSVDSFEAPMMNFFLAINVFIHSNMYSYYALKGLGVHVPKLISMAITSMQLLQMVIGILITGYVFWTKVQDETCQVPDRAIVTASIIYASYFVLFLNFFLKAYVVRKVPGSTSKEQVKKLK